MTKVGGDTTAGRVTPAARRRNGEDGVSSRFFGVSFHTRFNQLCLALPSELGWRKAGWLAPADGPPGKAVQLATRGGGALRAGAMRSVWVRLPFLLSSCFHFHIILLIIALESAESAEQRSRRSTWSRRSRRIPRSDEVGGVGGVGGARGVGAARRDG